MSGTQAAAARLRLAARRRAALLPGLRRPRRAAQRRAAGALDARAARPRACEPAPAPPCPSAPSARARSRSCRPLRCRRRGLGAAGARLPRLRRRDRQRRRSACRTRSRPRIALRSGFSPRQPATTRLRIGRHRRARRRRPPNRLKRRRGTPETSAPHAGRDPDRREEESRIRVRKAKKPNRQEHRRKAAHQAPAGQACVPDHALRPALRGGVRARLDVAVPVGDAREEGRAAVATTPSPTKSCERGGADQRPGPDRRNRRQLPDLHGNRLDRDRRRRTGARHRLRLPEATTTLPGQLASKHLTWRAYVAGHRRSGRAPRAPARTPRSGRPTRHRGRPPAAGPTRRSATRSSTSPSITRLALLRRRRRRPVGALAATSRSAKATPNLSYIVPDRCHDGNPTPCAPGAQAGLGGEPKPS